MGWQSTGWPPLSGRPWWRRSRPGSANLACGPFGWRSSTSTACRAARCCPPTPPSPRCPTGSTSPAPSTAWTPATRCSCPRSPAAAASASRSSPVSPTWWWCPTRPPSGCCHGQTGPAGCCATSTSATGSRCRSTAADCSAGCLATWPRPGMTTWPASRSSSLSSSARRSSWRRRTPASPRHRHRSACSSGAINSCPRCGWTAWATRWRQCGTPFSTSACRRDRSRTSGAPASLSSASHP